MSIEKQLEEILKTYTLKWYENQKQVFLNHKDYDKNSNKIISIKQDDFTDGDPDRVYTNYYDLETFLVYPLTSSIMGTNNAVFLIYNLIIKNTNSLASMTEKNMFATKTFYYSKSFLERNQHYKSKYKEYKNAIDRLIKDLMEMIFKKFVDTEKLTDFIKIKNQPLTLKPNLSKTVVDVFCNNLLDRCPNFIDEKYIEAFKSFLLQKTPRKFELNIDTNALAYIIYKLSDKFDIDENVIESWFESVKTNGKPVLKSTYNNSISKFNKNTGFPEKSIKAKHINDAISITLDVIN